MNSPDFNPAWMGDLLCSYARSAWSERRLMVLKVYVDDSSVNQPPVSVLAGWIAEPAVWRSFDDAWLAALRMRPRIQYFKYLEAMNFSGEFSGISEASRDEKIRLLVKVIEEHRPLGIWCAIPHQTFHKHFGQEGSGALRTPYPMLFVSLISRVHRHYLQQGSELPKIDFIFDQQMDQEEEATLGWYRFRRDASDELRPMIGAPPAFLDDKQALPLQAADLHAGWVRSYIAAQLDGRETPVPPWGNAAENLEVLTWTLSDEDAAVMKLKLSVST